MTHAKPRLFSSENQEKGRKSQQSSSSWREKFEKKKLLLNISGFTLLRIKYELWSKLAKGDIHLRLHSSLPMGGKTSRMSIKDYVIQSTGLKTEWKFCLSTSSNKCLKGAEQAHGSVLSKWMKSNCMPPESQMDSLIHIAKVYSYDPGMSIPHLHA